MAVELTLASLYTVGTKGRTVGGADEGWLQEEWTGTSDFLRGRGRVVLLGVTVAHTTLVLMGSAQVPCGGNLGESGREALSFSLGAVGLGDSLWLPRCHGLLSQRR